MFTEMLILKELLITFNLARDIQWLLLCGQGERIPLNAIQLLVLRETTGI